MHVLSSGLSAGSPPLLRSALRTLSFFRDYKSGLPSVLPHLARSETAHTPGSSHRQYRRSLCKPPRTEYASLSLSHIFRIHLRTTWLTFSLGKGSARQLPFYLWKNNKEEQAARTFWRSLNHAEPWLSIGCEIFCRQIVYFFCRFKSFSCWLSSNCVVYIKSTCFLYIVDC